MSDLIDVPDEGPDPSGNAPEFTVTEISGAVKRTIESAFSRIRVRAEIGRVSRPRSGHIYLDLKDERSVLSAVIWKGVANRLEALPEEGLEVVATGKLTTFGGQSKYQMVIEEIAPAGMGALMALLEKRKVMLEAEGLFAADRKKPLPYLPEVIGVITSPSGAVIRDILHRLRDRFPRKVLIWPVAVQGAKCAPEVARAIKGFNRLTPGGALPRPDLLIVARGGGSIEDLWGFNEESVARAAAASEIPLISAVGHETDTTLIDYVSDRRAPTPTAAAELAVPVRMELLSWVAEQDARLTRALGLSISQRQQRLRDLARALPKPQALVQDAEQRLDRWGERLPNALVLLTEKKRRALGEASAGLRPLALTGRIGHNREKITGLGRRLAPGLARAIALQKRDYEQRAQRLRLPVLVQDIDRKRNDLDLCAARFAKQANRQMADWTSRLEALERLRQTLGYRETLKRGYAVVRAEGQLVTTCVAAKQARSLEIEFKDGRFETAGSGAGSATARRKTTKSSGGNPDQGSLL